MTDMLFVRDHSGFTGGHLKFLDYMRHTQASGMARPRFYQTPRSRGAPGDIFGAFEGERVLEISALASFFVAGEDWFLLDAAGVETAGAPVVNLIQGFRHADPGHPLFACLSRAALRLCVSEAVADAVRPHANGEVRVVPVGVETGPGAFGPIRQPAGVAIAGWKRPALAREVAERLSPHVRVDPILQMLPRQAFLERLSRAQVSVLLPLDREGFFLPPLEAMRLGSAVVTLDCLGNDYCVHDRNCLLAPAEADALCQSALALSFDQERRERLLAAARRTAAHHSLERERRAYHQVLRRLLGAAP